MMQKKTVLSVPLKLRAGFKKQHGTDTCIYVMKEIINRYQRLGSSVYLSFLDASKAFDRINHDTLFKKLVNRNVPAYIVRLLVFWYSHQQMFVKWGNVMSSVFTVSNGVRQGGVLSPYLFNVYMDGLSEMLNTCIGVNRPAFGGTVPHFHQMSRVPRNETDVPHF